MGKDRASSRPLVCRGLRAAEHGRERLQRRANHVHIRLLRRQGRPGSLGMEAQRERAGVARAEAVPHEIRIKPAGGPEFGDLFQEIVVAVEKEGKARRKIVNR